jgi:hypothetical protein
MFTLFTPTPIDAAPAEYPRLFVVGPGLENFRQYESNHPEIQWFYRPVMQAQHEGMLLAIGACFGEYGLPLSEVVVDEATEYGRHIAEKLREQNNLRAKKTRISLPGTPFKWEPPKYPLKERKLSFSEPTPCYVDVAERNHPYYAEWIKAEIRDYSLGGLAETLTVAVIMAEEDLPLGVWGRDLERFVERNDDKVLRLAAAWKFFSEERTPYYDDYVKARRAAFQELYDKLKEALTASINKEQKEKA